jgi:hypothetical protein
MTNSTRSGWGFSVTPRPLFTFGKDPVPIVQEAGWGPGLVWTSAKNFVRNGIRSPGRPARSQSLYHNVHVSLGNIRESVVTILKLLPKKCECGHWRCGTETDRDHSTRRGNCPSASLATTNPTYIIHGTYCRCGNPNLWLFSILTWICLTRGYYI